LEGKIVDRDHGCRARAAIIDEIGGGQPRLPVMAVNNVGPEMRTFSESEASGDLAKRPEPEGIVRPIAPVRSCVGTACAREKMWSIEDKEVKPGGACAQHPGAAAKKVWLR